MDDPNRNNNKNNKLIIIINVTQSKGNAQELEMYNVIAQNVNIN
jgi:hypothetical protein